jgi:hypothetical protein
VPYCTFLEWEKDFDLDLYNQLNKRAGDHDALPPGCLGRVVGAVGSGARIIEIWASPEAARDFSVRNTPHARAAVQTGESVPIARAWLLDARAFYFARNFNMTVAAAAVACEVWDYELLRRHLVKGGRVSDAQARRFLEQVSNTELFATLFRYLQLLDAQAPDTLPTIFTENASP